VELGIAQLHPLAGLGGGRLLAGGAIPAAIGKLAAIELTLKLLWKRVGFLGGGAWDGWSP
jgi:hypothetical protein